MPATVCEISLDDEQLLYQAAVDSEFRAELVNGSCGFGMDSRNLLLPDLVEQQDQAVLKIWSEGLVAMQCASTCSYGPITIVCDGTTK